jgi:Amt family ammonium transporter
MSTAIGLNGATEAASVDCSKVALSAPERSIAAASASNDSEDNAHAFLESLPLMAFLEFGETITPANELARRFVGTDESIQREQVFLGAYPAFGDERRQRFECLLAPLAGPATQISGAVQPFEAAGAGIRLVLVMEAVEVTPDSVRGTDSDSKATFLEDLFDSAPEAMAIIQRDRILRVNREFARIFGYPIETCLGASLSELVVPDSRLHEIEMLLHVVENEGRATVETVRRTRTGVELDVSVVVTKVRIGAGRIGHSVTYRDIRQEKQAQAKLQHTALHDPLTGLANRVLFLDRLTLTMARLRRRPDRNFAVVFLDLDRFKQVNDTWGHAAGDTLLLTTTARLRACLRPQDTIARFGGDEFALVLDEVGCKEDIECLAERIQNELQMPVDIGNGNEVFVSASIGIALGSLEYNDVEEILHDADAAMYRAKANGRARHEFFTEMIAEEAMARETHPVARSDSEAA